VSSEKLKKVFNHKLIENGLKDCYQNKSEIIAWRFVADKKITAFVKFRILRKSKEEIVITNVENQELSKLIKPC
jgi:hypothetical protein